MGMIGNFNYVGRNASTLNALNQGLIGTATTNIDGKGNTVNFGNTGAIGTINTSTRHGAVTNLANAGFINQANMFDSRDQTNVLNAGLINEMNLTGWRGGEFNVNNLHGAIGSLNAKMDQSSVFNLLS